jgi:hypothetical protein
MTIKHYWVLKKSTPAGWIYLEDVDKFHEFTWTVDASKAWEFEDFAHVYGEICMKRDENYFVYDDGVYHTEELIKIES